MDKLKTGKYKRSYFCRESTKNFNFITCEDKIFIPLTIQISILNWYHAYILHTRLDIFEAMISKILLDWLNPRWKM